MDNTLGVIGTAHIKILVSKDKCGSEEYFNEHCEYSIKVGSICDHRLLFTSLNARSPGSLSNSSIWRSSLIKHYKLGSQNTWLLGDVTCPLEPWLLTRLELSYNDRLRSSHNCIKQPALNASPKGAGCIISTNVPQTYMHVPYYIIYS
ncbi:putative nuclease HARBI1 [Anastrepha ludens]|uniref:putative nuclease HARBI1 n=1 Tax=Anastrepha ludens TaxID=28586 RepID=UPI0023B1CE6D|nr:putative nuclease HARBI1 [Anastrepha ludens]